MSERRPLTPDVFDEEFTDAVASEWVARVIGADVPDGVDPFSFITSDGLREIATILDYSRGSTMVDLACGQGGPGVWLAQQIGTELIGIDFSPVGIAQARVRAAHAAPGVRADFRVADAASTGLQTASAQALVCIDAIQLMDHQVDVMIEVARLLEPGALAVFTTWEHPERLTDLGGVFEAGGLEVVALEDRPDWLDRERAIFERAVLDAPRYPHDRGLQSVAREAQQVIPLLGVSKRVLGVARRPK